MRSAVAVLPLVGMFLMWPSTSDAEVARLQLDLLSHLQFQGTSTSIFLPTSIEIPLQLTHAGNGDWEVVIDPTDLPAIPVDYPSGKTVKFTLVGPAKGSLSGAGAGQAVLEVAVAVKGTVVGDNGSSVFHLRFTTENTSVVMQEVSVARQGARVDLASGAVQLVASAVNVDSAATHAGVPFYVQLSGQIRDLPTSLGKDN